MANDFAAAMVDDYAGMGLGEKTGELSIRSLDGATEVELAALEEAGQAVGLQVYANSVFVREDLYTDEEFNRKFAQAMLSLLDA